VKTNTVRVPAFITPNSLTIARLVLIPFGAVALFMNGGDDYNWQIISWWIFFILGMTDVVDGKLARSRQQITELGKFLDPVADKAMVGTAAIVKRGVIPANKGGKIKAAFQGFGTGFYVLPLDPSLYWFRDGFMYVAIALTIATGAYYVRSAFKPQIKS